MTNQTALKTFRAWLQTEANGYADACSSYARENQEQPPNKMLYPYEVFQEAWDSIRILVDKDKRYKNSRSLDAFLWDYADHSESGIELYALYIRNRLPTVYGYNDEHVKALNKIIKKLAKVDT